MFFCFYFCGEPVAVEALGKQHVVASHAFVAGYYVEVGMVEGVSHVEVAAGIGRRSIDGEDWAFGVVPVETVDAHFFPFALPLLLNFEDFALFRQWFHVVAFTSCEFA